MMIRALGVVVIVRWSEDRLRWRWAVSGEKAHDPSISSASTCCSLFRVEAGIAFHVTPKRYDLGARYTERRQLNMKTLADIRQRMQPGARVEVTKHTKYPNQVGSVRTVLKCQSKSIKWDVGYSDWPSRKQVRFIDNDTYEYDLHDEKGEVYSTIGLRFLPEVQS